jgi:solute carrier family 25 phosphate transporter 3
LKSSKKKKKKKAVMSVEMEQTTSSSSWEAKLRGKKLEMFTGKYYAACAAGGMISAGSVHLLITPFDMLKVNMQVRWLFME